MSTVIKVENVSKQYKLGQVGTGTISHDVNRWWHRVRGKEDPYLKIGEENDRTKKGESDYVWALQDINFNVKDGEVLGIIGRNGAGKSTLLKILSRTTAPTTGSIKIKGRIASLLEVGTGFHPELSGRQNVFLNGAILGMTKAEIKRRFDEIVDFSGVERYIDTPVKRYSSGMYVRLAFGVAAHLEPEILIVDEVLAVGDAEFQKKCIGKMKDVSTNGGRTVLFVSHNMSAMSALCNSVIFMQNGKILDQGETSEIISEYLSEESDTKTIQEWPIENAPGDDAVRLISARLINNGGDNIDIIDLYKGGGIEFTYKVLQNGFCPIPNMHMFNQKGEHVFFSSDLQTNKLSEPGTYKAIMWIPPHFLNVGRHLAGLAVTTMVPFKVHFYHKESLVFDVIEDMNLRTIDYRGVLEGAVRPNLPWATKKIN